MLPLINLLLRLFRLKSLKNLESSLNCCPKFLEFSKEEKLSAQCPVGDAS